MRLRKRIILNDLEKQKVKKTIQKQVAILQIQKLCLPEDLKERLIEIVLRGKGK